MAAYAAGLEDEKQKEAYRRTIWNLGLHEYRHFRRQALLYVQLLVTFPALSSMTINHAQETVYPSYAWWYWSSWCIMFMAFAVCSAVFSIELAFGWFVAAEGLLGVSAYHFECGRFMGYLKSNYPQRRASMERQFLFWLVDFFHPALWHEIFAIHRNVSAEYLQARNIFRTTYVFSWVTLLVPIGIAWSGLYNPSSI